MTAAATAARASWAYQLAKGVRGREVDASETQRDGRETPSLTKASRDSTHRPDAMLRIDAIKSRRVCGHDVMTRRRGQNLHRVLDLLDHAGIGAIEVRKVGAPQDIAVETKIAHRGKRAFVRIER